jgi:hypothetical protein
MFRGIIAPLFAGVIVTGLTSTVYAKPIVPSQPENNFSTRSSESLRRIENRNIVKDFLTPSSTTSSAAEISPISLQDNKPTPVPLAPAEFVLGNNVKVSAGRPSPNSATHAPAHLELSNRIEVNAGASSLDSEQLVKVQYQLLSQPEK